MSLINNKNKVSITNSLKANGDNTYKVIEQLAKLGIFKTYKKRQPRKPKAGTQSGAGGVGGETTTEEEQKDDITSTAESAVNRILTTGNMLLSNITPRDGGFNNQRIEDIKREVGGQLAVLKDSVDKQRDEQQRQFASWMANNRGLAPIDRFRGITPNENLGIFFEDDEEPKQIENGQIEENEQDFTNEGSQNLPESVRMVDVSTQAPEIMEDEEPSGFIMQAEPQFETIEETPEGVTVEAEVKKEEPKVEARAEARQELNFLRPIKNASKSNKALYYLGLEDIKPNSSKQDDLAFLEYLNNNFKDRLGIPRVKVPKDATQSTIKKAINIQKMKAIDELEQIEDYKTYFRKIK